MSHSLLIYEPKADGHAAEFLLWAVQAWQHCGAPDCLVVAAPANVLSLRPALGDALAETPGATFVAIEPDTSSAFDALRRAAALNAVLRASPTDHVLVMSFEHLLLPLAARIAIPGRTRLSALSFRPVLHYTEIGSPPRSAREAATRWAKTRLARRALRHPAMEALLSLDEAAVPALRALAPGLPVTAVPDPVPPEVAHLTPAQVRSSYGVAAGRRLVVLPGTLDIRKGALALPEALLRMDAAVGAGLAVLMAGVIPSDAARAVRALCARVAAETPVQMILHDAYVPLGELSSVVAAADLVALPYDQHVGSSGFQMRAAAAGVPALTQAWGLMGHLARTHRLGPTADPADPEAFARALAAALAGDTHFDAAAARAFSAAHTVEAFGAALLAPVLGLP
ncbi:MAG TPA: hypothetical protein VGB53_10135 [Rubricoccaceae bacterium]|jgi:glycosyltransferase involved in cell wall biosynthesis